MEKSLYERLGEEKGISQLVTDVLDIHMANPAVSPRFQILKEDAAHYKIIRQHSINFFCAGSGGPQTYSGKGMLGAHKAMNISEQEFLAVVDDVMEGMDKNNLGENEKKDVLAILYSLKEEVIRV